MESNIGLGCLLRPIMESNIGLGCLLRPIMESNIGLGCLLRPIMESSIGLGRFIKTDCGIEHRFRLIVEASANFVVLTSYVITTVIPLM